VDDPFRELRRLLVRGPVHDARGVKHGEVGVRPDLDAALRAHRWHHGLESLAGRRVILRTASWRVSVPESRT